MHTLLLLLTLLPNTKTDTSQHKVSQLINAYLDLPVLAAPIIKFEPETGLNFGLTAFYRFKPNKSDSSGSISIIKTDLIYTTENQFFASIKHQIFGKNRAKVYRGYVGYHYFPYKFWGIGNTIQLSEYETYYPTYWQFSQSFFKRLRPSLYLGLSGDIMQFQKMEYETNSQLKFSQTTGIKGQTNTGIGGGAMWDNRDNVLNAHKGLFIKSIIETYGLWNMGTFKYQSVQNDIRKFYYISPLRSVIALQLLNQMQWGDIPFYALSFLGGEQMMRGYYSGAYRNKHMQALQVEIRAVIHKKWGFVSFLSSGFVNEDINYFKNQVFHLATGGGIRYKFDTKNNINLRFDIAYSKMGPGAYLGIGEAF
jgi:hypothetical protein